MTDKKEKTRTCIVTRETAYRDELLRFVIGPQGNVVADLREKLPGRGVWVTNNRQSLQKACTKNLFAAGFRQQVKVDIGILDEIEDLMLADIARSLSMAKKAGLVITGFAKVETLARLGKVKILFHASDGREDGLAKIKSALGAGQAAGGYLKGLPRPFTGLSSIRLDEALGMSNSVHVACISGGAANMVRKRIARLEGYRK